MSDELRPKWRRRKEERPAEIIAAALAEFADRGFAGARLEDVAKRAGVSKGTLYLYFPNKDELFKAVVRETLIKNITETEGLVAAFPGPTIDLMDIALTNIFRRIVLTDLVFLPKLVIGEASRFPDITAFYFENVIQRMLRVMSAIVARGVARGEFRDMPLEGLSAVIGPLLLAAVWRTVFAEHAPDSINVERLLAAHRDNIRRILLKDVGGTS